MTRGVGSMARLRPPTWMATSDRSSETVMTGTGTWRATRSAVRCRVPVSEVGMFESGTRCALERTIREQSAVTMMAPSILASSESRCGVNSASRRNPPEQTWSTSGPAPTTRSAPMRAWMIRSMPSRSPDPGATRRRAARRASERGGGGVEALVELRAGDGQRHREVESGLTDPHAADDVGVHVGVAQRFGAAGLEHREEEAQAGAVEPGREPARGTHGGRDEGLHLDEQPPGAVQGPRDPRARPRQPADPPEP